MSHSPPPSCSFSTADWNVLASFWHPVGFSTGFSETPRSVTLLDVDIMIVRVEGKLLAVRDRCPHRGTRLSHGRYSNGEFVCAYHGMAFAVNGDCVRVPSATPGYKIPNQLRLERYHCCERYGVVWVCLTDESRAPLPEWPVLEDESVQRIDLQMPLETGAGRHIENFCDTAHFAFVHLGTFGSADHPRVPDYEVTESNGAIVFTVTTFLKAEGKPGDHSPEVVEVPTTYSVFLPYLAELKEDMSNESTRCIFDLMCPVSATRCHMYMILTRDCNFASPLEEWIEYQERVNEEDRIIVEAQDPLELPIAESREVHVPADLFSLTYRRRLRALGMTGPG